MKHIVCLGDSLTEGADLETNYRWTALVENALGVKVANKGIGGDTTGGMLSRFYPDVAAVKPDIVVILGGTNDIWWDLDVNTIQANIFATACQAKSHDIAPIVGLPLPVFREAAEQQDFAAPSGGYERCLDSLSALTKALKKSAVENDIPILDFYRPFFDERGEVAGNYFLEDGLHANKEGHRLMARESIELLRAVFFIGGPYFRAPAGEPDSSLGVEKC